MSRQIATLFIYNIWQNSHWLLKNILLLYSSFLSPSLSVFLFFSLSTRVEISWCGSLSCCIITSELQMSRLHSVTLSSEIHRTISIIWKSALFISLKYFKCALIRLCIRSADDLNSLSHTLTHTNIYYVKTHGLPVLPDLDWYGRGGGKDLRGETTRDALPNRFGRVAEFRAIR